MAYPGDRFLDSEALIAYLETRLPLQPVVLVAESFSSHLACLLAVRYPQRVKALVLVAGFVSSPRPLTRWLARWLPLPWLMRFPPPAWALRRFALGKDAPDQLIEQFYRALATVAPRVLAARLRAILALPSPDYRIEVPTPYLQASNDCLVPTRSAQQALTCIPRMEIVRVPGTHLLLQGNPAGALAPMVAFLTRIGG